MARFSHAFCLRTEGEPLWAQVKGNDQRAPDYRPDLAGRDRWADPDWFKPARD